MKDESKLASQVMPHCDRIVRETQNAIRTIEAQATAVEAHAAPAAIEFVKTGDGQAKARAEGFIAQAQSMRATTPELQERVTRWTQIKELVKPEMPSAPITSPAQPAAAVEPADTPAVAA